MESSPAFSRGRAIMFSLIAFISLIWLILLSVLAFVRWDELATTERSFAAVLVLTNTLSLIGLPILILVEFRPWLDAARILLLLVAHIGPAIVFAAWFPSLQCPIDSAGEQSACELINVLLLSLSWVIPVLLIGYAICLGIYWRIRAQAPPTTDVEASVTVTIEVSDDLRVLPSLPSPGASARPRPRTGHTSFSGHRSSHISEIVDAIRVSRVPEEMDGKSMSSGESRRKLNKRSQMYA